MLCMSFHVIVIGSTDSDAVAPREPLVCIQSSHIVWCRESCWIAADWSSQRMEKCTKDERSRWELGTGNEKCRESARVCLCLRWRYLGDAGRRYDVHTNTMQDLVLFCVQCSIHPLRCMLLPLLRVLDPTQSLMWSCCPLKRNKPLY
jgi:hypothetical protein